MAHATFTELTAFIATLPECKRAPVHELWAQATAYVWGYQDAGGDPRNSGTAWEFGIAYGMHAAEYAAERRCSRHPIQDAYRSFVAGKPIGDRTV